MKLIQTIDHWAATSPFAIAHQSGNASLTYAQLVAQANRVAVYLEETGKDDPAPIAVLGHREPEMLVAFLAAAKSGRAYIPIDTALPADRISHILSIAKPRMVLTPNDVAHLAAVQAGLPASRIDWNSDPRLGPDDPFYIIFTSGSTGTPKGIVITLRCLEHFLGCMLNEQQFRRGGEVFLNQAPFSFDLSVMDLYCSLATGGTLFSLSRELLANPKMLFKALGESKITCWVSTPSFVEMCLVERTFGTDLMPEVRRFLFCGETLSATTVGTLRDRFPAAEIWNFYGPTEATVATTSVRLDDNVLSKYVCVPIGRPMRGTELLLVDEQGNGVSAGERGEIVIRGPNVSPGYLGRPDLTAAQFFEQDGARAYRTGDWGRLCDGLLFFEGRKDNQIKLNGYRIELTDLETNLRALSMVRDAAVVPKFKDDKVQWLAGFIVPNSRSNGNGNGLTNTIRERLRERLPAYMVPRKFILLDAFPITANGKIDRARLAASL